MTFRKLDVLLLVLFLAFISDVRAEGRCPDGYFPVGGGNGGWGGCAPITPPTGGSNYQVPDPGPRWATRWGAIAIDGSTGSFAGMEGLSSKRKAQKAAVKECQNKGGKQCKVIAAYYNQCGAMAYGDTRYSSYMGPQTQETQDLAVQECNKQTTNCRAYYVGCSYPEQIR
jgi:hypothetical protein